ncbi:UNVERIFIED_CONTAM: chromate transporter [Brevibacillus sp. OAP136]
MGVAPYREIVIAMVRTGIIGYGGGPSVMPLIRHEAVNKYKWVSEEEFGEILALANALPGPIATKMAAYLGYQQKKGLGAIVAVLAHILPTNLAMVALLGILYALKDSAVIVGMIEGVRPVIAVMLAQMAYEFFMKAWKGLGKAASVCFAALAFLLLSIIDLHPAIVVAAFLLYGAFHLRVMNWIKRRREEEQPEQTTKSNEGVPL